MATTQVRNMSEYKTRNGGVGSGKTSKSVRQTDFVIVANRLPVQRVTDARGKQTWKTSPGGLVSALQPVLAERECTWVGWHGGEDDFPAALQQDNIRHVSVRLSPDEIEHYYEGFSNRTIWPLYHDAVRPPEYHRHWWNPYVDVNGRFALAASKSASKGGTVWIHDYQLQLVPAMLRSLRPDLRIGFFLHIPFPPPELFSQLPWRSRILEGLLGADVVGFQKPQGAENFAQSSRRLVGASGPRGELEHEGRRIHVGAFPISIDFNRYERLARDPAVQRRAAGFRESLGGNRKIILGVDRLDYTKGIDIRLRAFRDLLTQNEAARDGCVLVQVAVPSREQVIEYQELRSTIEQLVGQINGEFGELGHTPVRYLHRSLPPEELVALYLAADVMIVTPLRDGMNLVAKEYVATRVDGTGVLLLSEFTGSANELKSAILVNPHDIDGLVASLDAALNLGEKEQKRRMHAMRRVVKRNDVFFWAERFLEALGTSKVRR